MKSLLLSLSRFVFLIVAAFGLGNLYAGSWELPTVLQLTGTLAIDDGVITLDGDGNATALWSDISSIKSATKPYGSPWDSTETLGSLGGYNSEVALATSRSGHSIAVWFNQTTHTTYYATRTFGGSWSAEAVVPAVLAFRTAVAIDESGNATLVYFTNSTDVYGISLPFGGSWSTPTFISPNSGNYLVDVAVDGLGNVAAIFGPSFTSSTVYVAELPFGGSWQPAIALGNSGSYTPPADTVLAVGINANQDGDFVAIWNKVQSSAQTIQAATKDFGGSWSAPTQVSSIGIDATNPSIAVDDSGNGVASWLEDVLGPNRVFMADRPAGGSWTTGVFVSDPNANVSGPVLAINPGGYASIGYNSIVSPSVPFVTRRPIGGVWCAPVRMSSNISTTNFGLGIGVDPFDNSYLLFGVFDFFPIDASNTHPIPWSLPVVQTWSVNYAVSLVGDDSGDTTNIWYDFDQGQMRYRTKVGTGVWSNDTLLAAKTYNYVVDSSAYMNGTGYTAVAWTEFDGAGNHLFASVQQFGGSWSTPVELLATTGAINVNTVVDPSGNTVLVYTDSTANITYSRTLPFGGSWGAAVPIYTGVIGPARDLVVDGSGNITLVIALSNQVVAFNLPFGGSWSSATPVSPVYTSVVSIDAAANDTGNIEAVWEATSGGVAIVVESTLPFGGSWSSPTQLSTGGVTSTEPHVGIDAIGNAVATWLEDSGTAILRGSTKPNAGSWSAAVNISDGVADAQSPSLSMNAGGTVLALWLQNNGFTNSARESHLSFGGSWTTQLEIENIGAENTYALVDPSNVATAVWEAQSPEQTSELVASTRSLGAFIIGLVPDHGPTAGGTVVTITGGGFTGATQVYFGTDPATSFTVLDDGTITAVSPPHAVGPVYVTVVTPSGTTPEVTAGIFTYTNVFILGLSPDIGPTAGGTVVTITGGGFTGTTQVYFGTDPAASFTVLDDGTITAVSPPHAVGPVYVTVVSPSGTSPEVVAGIFTYVESGPPSPPSSFNGKAGSDRFLTQTDKYNRLTWTASTDPAVVSYRLYRDADLLAEIPADSLFQYIDHNRRKGVIYVYTLVAVNGLGLESTPLVVTLKTK